MCFFVFFLPLLQSLEASKEEKHDSFLLVQWIDGRGVGGWVGGGEQGKLKYNLYKLLHALSSLPYS